MRVPFCKHHDLIRIKRERKLKRFKFQVLSFKHRQWPQSAGAEVQALFHPSCKKTISQPCQLSWFHCCCKKESEKNLQIGIRTSLYSLFSLHPTDSHQTAISPPPIDAAFCRKVIYLPTEGEHTFCEKGGDGKVWDSPPGATQQSETTKKRWHRTAAGKAVTHQLPVR